MKAEFTAIIEDGVLKPDTALPFPDHTRVTLTLEPVEEDYPTVAAWQRLKERIREHPIRGLAGRSSREEFHERA